MTPEENRHFIAALAILAESVIDLEIKIQSAPIVTGAVLTKLVRIRKAIQELQQMVANL